MIIKKSNYDYAKQVPSNSLNILVNTKEKLLQNITRYPVLYIDTADVNINISKSGSLFNVNNKSFTLNDLKIGDLINKLVLEYNITSSIAYDKILCELPSTLLQDFNNQLVVYKDIYKSPFDLREILKTNSTILATNESKSFVVLDSNLKELDFQVDNNLLYSRLDFTQTPDKLIAKTSATSFYCYFVKDFIKIDDAYLTNFGDIYSE